MLSNVGHTIQKMINNTPISVTVNDTTSSVVTNGGNVFQAGLIQNKIQNYFKEVMSNENILGKVIDAKSTEDAVYFLNKAGSVFRYEYNAHKSCDPVVKEVYSPIICDGDKAIKIDTGRGHVLILTEKHRVFGAGDNSQYQLVPQGQCRYDVAVEIIITDTNVHDNTCCKAFTGCLNQPDEPVIPGDNQCGEVNCLKDTEVGVPVGTLNLSNITFTPNNLSSPVSGTLSLPLCGDYSYVSFLCTDCHEGVIGNLTYCITRLYIKPGCYPVTINGTTITVNITGAEEIVVFNNTVQPITDTVKVTGSCDEIFFVSIPDIDLGLLNPDLSAIIGDGGVPGQSEGAIMLLDGTAIIATICACCGTFSLTDIYAEIGITASIDPVDVKLRCCKKPKVCDQILPQPCWMAIYAGFDTSVLVDSCNRLYVLGSIHEVRNNKDLLKRSCLEELLSKTNASITLPADQLNCCVRPRNETCQCIKCRDKCFDTDLSKFGIHLSFPQDDCNSDPCCDYGDLNKTTNVCDFLKALQRCNEAPLCDNTCTVCDTYIYLDVSGENCPCPCGDGSGGMAIGKILLYNKISVCKSVSQPNISHVKTIDVTTNSTVEFDLNRYCVDEHEFSLQKILCLNFLDVDGPTVCIYVDIDCPGGIVFNTNELKDGKRRGCNVEFPIFRPTPPLTLIQNESDQKFLLNFGSILDPVELTNLKQAFALDCFYPCPRFKNPFDTKLFNTYVKGGDRVKFVSSGCDLSRSLIGATAPVRQAVTPDVPTVFRLNRRVLDVGVGWNNLSVLIGGLACPNEICVIGNNCNGELGINSNESVVCWKQVNRCLFDCQVNAIFSGKYVTFYITQSNRIFASGQWKCLVDSNIPVCIPSFCQSWKIKQIAVSKTHILLLGSDGLVYGLGDNSLGELGLCHVECVPKPVALTFFYRLSQKAVKELSYSYRHPIEKSYYNRKCGKCGCNPCKCDPCNPCRPVDFTPPCKPICDKSPCPKLKPCNSYGCDNDYGHDDYDRQDYGHKSYGHKQIYDYKSSYDTELCGGCNYNPCRCEVRYYKYPRKFGLKKYIPNARCCVIDKYGKY